MDRRERSRSRSPEARRRASGDVLSNEVYARMFEIFFRRAVIDIRHYEEGLTSMGVELHPYDRSVAAGKYHIRLTSFLMLLRTRLCREESRSPPRVNTFMILQRSATRLTLGEAIGVHAEAALQELDELEDGATDSEVEAEIWYARARGLEASARALDDATQEYAPVDAADPIDTTQPEPAALAHAPSPDAVASLVKRAPGSEVPRALKKAACSDSKHKLR